LFKALPAEQRHRAETITINYDGTFQTVKRTNLAKTRGKSLARFLKSD